MTQDDGPPKTPQSVVIPEQVRRAKYISLTTYRRSGAPVSTPIWFAIEGERIVAFTGAQTGKVKRIRSNSSVSVAPCTFRGRLTGETLKATACILQADRSDSVMRLIRRKYRITKTLLDLWVGLIRIVVRKPQTHSVCLEIQLVAPES